MKNASVELAEILRPLLFRIYQIESIQIAWDDDYVLPDSNYNIQLLPEQTASYASEELLNVLEFIHAIIIGAFNKLEEFEQIAFNDRVFHRRENALETIAEAKTELKTFLSIIYNLNGFHSRLVEIKNNTSLVTNNIAMLKAFRPKWIGEPDYPLKNQEQYALLYRYVESSGIIYKYDNQTIGTILYVLTGYSDNTSGDAVSFNRIKSLKKNKDDLNALEDYLESLLKTIRLDIDTSSPKDHKTSRTK